MDTLKKTPEEIEQVLQVIKTKMPNVYAAIRAKAAQIGPQAFKLVREGVRGEPYKFYAMENGHVVGTPFEGEAIQAEVAALMCSFGCSHFILWARVEAEVAA